MLYWYYYLNLFYGSQLTVVTVDACCHMPATADTYLQYVCHVVKFQKCWFQYAAESWETKKEGNVCEIE